MLTLELDAEAQREIFKSVSFSRWGKAFETIVEEILYLRTQENKNALGLDKNLEDKHLFKTDALNNKYPHK